MDLKKIKEIKRWLDDGLITQEVFTDLKTRYINGEDFALIELDALVPEHPDITETGDSNKPVGVKYSKEEFDKFTNKKTLKWVNILHNGKKHYRLGETHETIFHSGTYGLRYIKTPDFTSILIDYEFYGNDWLFIRQGKLYINLDDVDNIVLDPTESNTEVGYLGTGWVYEVGYYNISQDQLKKVAYSKKIEVRFTSGKGSGDLTGDGLEAFEFMIKSMYQDITGDKQNLQWLISEVRSNKTKSESESGCFIATAAMGSYDHPLVLDLRFFRDNWLSERSWGESFITNYYNYSPKYASIIDQNKFLKLLSYIFIVKPLHIISKLLDVNK